MPNDNLIKTKQLDPSVADYIRQITSGDTRSAIETYIGAYVPTGYFGPNVLYISGSTQTVSGAKSFILPLTIPYSGGTGQTVNQQFVLDSQQFVLDQLSGLFNIPNLLHTTGNESALGIKTFDSISGNSLSFTGLALVPTATSNVGSAINLNFFYSKGIVFNSGSQTISGTKQFVSPPTMSSEATQNTQAVRFSQLISSGNQLQQQINSLALASGVSGFGGVLSFNSHSGNLYSVGRAGITVTQVGDTTFISGNAPFSFINSGTLTGSFFDTSFFVDLPYTGINIMETFVSHTGILTGYAIGCYASGFTGAPMSGSIYTRDTGNNKVSVLNFVFNTGELFQRGGMSANFSPFYRIGLDIYSQISGVQGLTIGLFGMEWS